MPDVIILMGSKSDMPHVEKIVAGLERLELSYKLNISSAHKSATHLMGLLAQYEAAPSPKVYITVAGRSNALSGLVDAHVTAPVIHQVGPAGVISPGHMKNQAHVTDFADNDGREFNLAFLESLYIHVRAVSEIMHTDLLV